MTQLELPLNDPKNSPPVAKDSRLHYVPKGWGYELWITNNEKYCGKILFFVKDRKCSIHKHLLKAEHFYLNSGLLLIRYGYKEDLSDLEERVLYPGEAFEVPVGMIHQMEAIQDSQLFEFSTTHYDSDSYRIQKGD